MNFSYILFLLYFHREIVSKMPNISFSLNAWPALASPARSLEPMLCCSPSGRFWLPLLGPFWPVFSWVHRQLREPKMQETGTAIPPQKPSPRSILGSPLWDCGNRSSLDPHGRHHWLGSTEVAKKDVARWENSPTGKSLGDNQFHSEYSALSHSESTQFDILVYRRAWEMEVNPWKYPSESGEARQRRVW